MTKFAAATRAVGQTPSQPANLPEVFLTCYEISNPDFLRWNVRLYNVRRDSGGLRHTERGDAKQVIWSLRKKHKEQCRGYGFVVDVDEETVAVPNGWRFPDNSREGEYSVFLDSEFTTDPMNRQHRAVITGILREGLKKYFKENRSEVLGDWWQDFDRFCQIPKWRNGAEFHFCRKFGVAAKVLIGDRWGIQPLISTATLDGKTFAGYFRDGEVGILTERIEAKQANRIDRRNRSTAVRVFRDESTSHHSKASVLELDEPNLLSGIAGMSKRRSPTAQFDAAASIVLR
jgi:hypothetical protein